MQNHNPIGLVQQVNKLALVVRNHSNKQMFDVIIVDYEIPHLSRVILEGVSFELASLYTEDYNNTVEKTKGIEP